MIRDIRQGVCPLCAHQEIIEAVPALFGDADAEKVQAVTYDPRWVMQGRNPNHPRGTMRLYVCRHCGYSQTFADDPGDIPIGEEHKTRLIRREGAAAADPSRHRLQTHHGALYLSDTCLEQDWPNGAVHSITWDRPFKASFHRAPAQGFTGPVADIHVRLQQNGEERASTVAFTVSLEDTPEIRRLEPLIALLPKLEGDEAQAVLDAVVRALRAHGEAIPI